MSKKLSFEEALKQKLNKIPVPDEEVSWQKMKQLLEEKDKRKPFIFLTNYKAWSGILLLLTGLVAATFFIIKKQTGNEKINQNTIANANSKYAAGKNKHDKVVESKSSGAENYKKENSPGYIMIEKNKAVSAKAKVDFLKSNQHVAILNHQRADEKNIVTTGDTISIAKSKAYTQVNKNDTITASENFNTGSEADISVMKNNNINNLNAHKETPVDSIQNFTLKNSNDNNTSSAIQAQKNIVIKKPVYYFIDAGIQVKQQLPIGGQKLNAYNYHGNKNIFADYTPSLFIRFQKNNQWYVQGEFFYASPQVVNAFNYAQQTTVDYAHGLTTVKTLQLQKTYYSRLPLSFNYYLKPHWSAGLGFVQSWFNGAVAKEQVVTSYAQASKQVAANNVMPLKGFEDSFFYRSHAGIFFQTAYEKNKWGFAFRFTHDVQPYLTYTLPDGVINNKRNMMLEFLLRYRLFRFNRLVVRK